MSCSTTMTGRLKEKETLPSAVDREWTAEECEGHAEAGLYSQHCPQDLESALSR